MLKTLLFTVSLAFASVILSGCSDEQDERMGQNNELDADPEWSENPYGEEDGRDADNPQSAEEINRNNDEDDDAWTESEEDKDSSGLDEATEQGVGQQY